MKNRDIEPRDNGVINAHGVEHVTQHTPRDNGVISAHDVENVAHLDRRSLWSVERRDTVS
jgi:hypothetical protein